MEYLKGTKISQIEMAQHDRAALAQHIVEAAFRQLFEDGLFHGDPHPGNLLVLEGDVVGLLDFGLVGRLTSQMQETLVMLVLSVALKGADSVARLLYRLGDPDGSAGHQAFKAGIQESLN